MKKINTHEFILKVRDMRAAQKEYFKSRTSESLSASRSLEMQVDAIIEKTLESERKTNGPKEDSEMS